MRVLRKLTVLAVVTVLAGACSGDLAGPTPVRMDKAPRLQMTASPSTTPKAEPKSDDPANTTTTKPASRYAMAAN